MLCSRNFRLSNAICFSFAFAILLNFHSSAIHADEDANDFNYVYGAVLGTGYYKSDVERLLILRMPLSHQLNWGNARLLAPVAIGLRDSKQDQRITDQFGSISIMPGLAWTFDLRENWQISPVAQFGFAHDLNNNNSSWVGSTAVRHNAWWDMDSGRLTLAQRLRLAGQRNRDGGDTTGFITLEQGADWEFDTGWTYSGNKLTASVFVLWQEYLNDIDIRGVGEAQVSIDRMFQVGLTTGFKQPLNIGWIPLGRIGISVGRGNGLEGNKISIINLNLGFPLVED